MFCIEEHEAAQIHSRKKLGRSSLIDNRPRTPLTPQNRISADEAIHLVDLIYDSFQVDVIVKVSDLLPEYALVTIKITLHDPEIIVQILQKGISMLVIGQGYFFVVRGAVIFIEIDLISFIDIRTAGFQ